MSDLPISGLTAATACNAADLVEISQAGGSRKATKLMIVRPEAIETVIYAASTTIDLSTRVYSPFIFKITLTGNLALNFSNGFDGQVIRAILIQGGSGSYTWTPGAAIRFSDDITGITLSTTVAKWDRIGFEWYSSKADVTAYNKGYA